MVIVAQDYPDTVMDSVWNGTDGIQIIELLLAYRRAYPDGPGKWTIYEDWSDLPCSPHGQDRARILEEYAPKVIFVSCDLCRCYSFYKYLDGVQEGMGLVGFSGFSG